MNAPVGEMPSLMLTGLSVLSDVTLTGALRQGINALELGDLKTHAQISDRWALGTSKSRLFLRWIASEERQMYLKAAGLMVFANEAVEILST